MSIRAIMVGCGNFALGRLEALLKTERFEVVSLVDRYPKAIEQAKDRFAPYFKPAPREYSTLEEALQGVEADACFIVSASTHHAEMARLSLAAGLNTMVIKPLALTLETGRYVLREYQNHPDLVLAVGQNKRWNPASRYMQSLLQDSDAVGSVLGGELRFWIRQDLRLGGQRIQPDGTQRGEFFFAAASHQIDQLVAALGLPQWVTARTDRRLFEPQLGQVGVDGTAGGQAMFDYGNFVVVYTGTRAAHANLADWSGYWSFRGVNGDLTRKAGEIKLYRKGALVETKQLQDLSPGLIDDDRLQYIAFADAIEGDDHARAYLASTIDSWILALGCNLSEVRRESINLRALREEVWAR